MPRFRTIKLEVDPSETVQSLKLKLSKEGFPVWQQRIVHGGTQMDELACLSDYDITNDSTLHLVLTPGETKKGRHKKNQKEESS